MGRTAFTKEKSEKLKVIPENSVKETGKKNLKENKQKVKAKRKKTQCKKTMKKKEKMRWIY